MPSRTAIDPEVVLKLYKELQSGRETAKRLGLHENTVYQVLRVYKGQCKRCGKSTPPGRKHCARCLKALAAGIKTRRKARRTQGICQQCNDPVAPPSQVFCAAHRTQRQTFSNRYHAKERRLSPGRYGAPLPGMREKQLRYNYGEAGVNVWRAAEGCCQLCGIPHATRAVHIHHIDGEDTNHAEANLVCLCYSCHKAVHLVVGHPHLPRLLAWLRSTYPTLPWD